MMTRTYVVSLYPDHGLAYYVAADVLTTYNLFNVHRALSSSYDIVICFSDPINIMQIAL